LSIDFGTSNTSAGMYIDTDFFEKVRDGIQPGQLKEAAINYYHCHKAIPALCFDKVTPFLFI